MENQIWDVAVVGAGAAGLMTAITARRKGAKVLLLDGREKIGAKILMSGGTRCNVTNQKVRENDFQSEMPRTIRNILSAFPSDRAVEFFKGLGVEVVLEPNGKYFPTTHSGKTVLDALLRESGRNGIELKTSSKIRLVKFLDGSFQLSDGQTSYLAKNVVLCTGGLSFPSSGSDGVGYEIAKSFGHHLIKTTPSLTPLTGPDNDWKSLSGVTLPVALTLFVDDKKDAFYEGSFLFTHFGFSGPSVLNISRHWIRATGKKKLEVNFLPDKKEEEIIKELKDSKKINRIIKNILNEFLQERLVDVILKKADISSDLILNQLSREAREKLVHSIFHHELPINGALGYEKAEVTAGGINLSEVNSKTLESKLQSGLFFAGEILDVDGRIGGFNFQWAWSSGFVVGSTISSN